jgi:hypothetical protein
MFAGFHLTVLRKVLGQSQHQRLAPVEYVDTLALRFGEVVRRPDRITGDGGTDHKEDNPEKAYLLKTRFDVF